MKKPNMTKTLTSYLKGLPSTDLPMFMKMAQETGLRISKITRALHTVNLQINVINKTLKK